MNDGDAIRRAILEEPAEDVHRLVYADWLEENGQGAPGYIIRVRVTGENKVKSSATWDMKWGWQTQTGGIQFGNFMPGSWADWICRSLPASEGVVYVCRRGFVSSVSCPLPVWLEHGQAICAVHPIERVDIADREPHPDFLDQGWVGFYHSDRNDGWFSHRQTVPKWLWVLLGKYRGQFGPPMTAEKALRNLGIVCLDWARELNGLKPLERVNA